ncbi:hypothetical protein E2C01_050418 [Portunus trituberculatus]|uniref:Uncharacterized protein n=1 Tax=Portunus trituberculatus TaxID=210409 RepID=A0A5B7GGQ5_PORTR|nr:hypothetical protein [Portunus trituberculatus]
MGLPQAIVRREGEKGEEVRAVRERGEDRSSYRDFHLSSLAYLEEKLVCWRLAIGNTKRRNKEEKYSALKASVPKDDVGAGCVLQEQPPGVSPRVI